VTLFNSLVELKTELSSKDNEDHSANLIDLINLETENLCKTWFEAERLVKQCEKMADKLKFPCINELRYAGRRVVHALGMLDGLEPRSPEDEEIWSHRPANIEGEDAPPPGPQGEVPTFNLRTPAGKQAYAVLRDIIEATENCQKASHDAIDEIFFVLGRKFRSMENAYGYGAVVKQVGEWDELKNMLVSVRDKMSASRQGSFNHRTELYREIEDTYLERAIELYDIIDRDNRALADTAEKNSLEAKAEKKRLFEKELKDNKHRNISYGLSAAGILLSIVGLILTITSS